MNELEVKTPKGQGDKSLKGKRPKTILSNTQLAELINDVAMGLSAYPLSKKYKIGNSTFKKIVVKYSGEIEKKKQEMLVEREKTISPLLMQSVSDALREIVEKKKFSNAKFGELARGIEALYKVLRLHEGKSTENVGLDLTGKSREELLRYVYENEQIDLNESNSEITQENVADKLT